MMAMHLQILILIGFASVFIQGHPFERNMPVSGCTKVSLPNNMWSKLHMNYALVGCYTSQHIWRVDCVNDTWRGTIGNCTEDDYDQTCWSKLKQRIWDVINTINKIDPSVILMIGEGVGLHHQPTEEEITWLACQLEQIHTISDLAKFLESSETWVRRNYIHLQNRWRAVGGMYAVYLLGDVLNKTLQLMVDIDFPNEIPLTSMSRSSWFFRIAKISEKTPDAYRELLLNDKVFQEQLVRFADALYESRNAEAFAETMGLDTKDMNRLRNIREHASTAQQLGSLLVALIEEVHCHGLMDLQ